MSNSDKFCKSGRVTARRKLEIIKAVRKNPFDKDSILADNHMTSLEFSLWKARFDSHKLDGLCVTKLQQTRK